MHDVINKTMPEVTILIWDNHIGVIPELMLNKALANNPEIPHITQANPAKNAHKRRCFCVAISINFLFPIWFQLIYHNIGKSPLKCFLLALTGAILDFIFSK